MHTLTLVFKTLEKITKCLVNYPLIIVAHCKVVGYIFNAVIINAVINLYRNQNMKVI